MLCPITLLPSAAVTLADGWTRYSHTRTNPRTGTVHAQTEHVFADHDRDEPMIEHAYTLA